MVSVIKYFTSDPNHQGRGAGVYYLRGHGIYSKYSVQRDKNKLSTGWRVSKVGVPKGTRIPQVGDGKLWR